jgi:hypothetical protein
MNLRQQIAADLAKRISGCTLGVDMGHGCLMIDNKIFAFTRADESGALKLPEARITELVNDGEIRHLVMGKRTMREWVVVPDIAATGNLPLLFEAKAYVASLPKQERRRSTKKSSKKAVKKTAAKAVKKATKKAAKKR